MERNLKCPAFRSATYSANINHDDDVDDEVITVTAEDDDDKVLKLMLTIYQPNYLIYFLPTIKLRFARVWVANTHICLISGQALANLDAYAHTSFTIIVI